MKLEHRYIEKYPDEVPVIHTRSERSEMMKHDLKIYESPEIQKRLENDFNKLKSFLER